MSAVGTCFVVAALNRDVAVASTKFVGHIRASAITDRATSHTQPASAPAVDAIAWQFMNCLEICGVEDWRARMCEMTTPRNRQPNCPIEHYIRLLEALISRCVSTTWTSHSRDIEQNAWSLLLYVLNGRAALQLEGLARLDDISGLDKIDPRSGTMSSFMQCMRENRVGGPFATEGRRTQFFRGHPAVDRWIGTWLMEWRIEITSYPWYFRARLHEQWMDSDKIVSGKVALSRRRDAARTKKRRCVSSKAIPVHRCSGANVSDDVSHLSVSQCIELRRKRL